MSGKLYLIPTVLAEGTEHTVLPAGLKSAAQSLSYFLCENVRTARRFISRLQVHPSIESLHFELLDKDTPPEALTDLLRPLSEGHDMGLISESGCPGIADPGAQAVAYAHDHGIQVVPLTGPSSILLSLMASGLNGQQFAFHGYLPVDAKQASVSLRTLERESREKNQTQIFIETPYRNNQRLSSLLQALQSDTLLCLAMNLTAPDEKIICLPVSQWKKRNWHLEKVPVTFLFLAAR